MPCHSRRHTQPRIGINIGAAEVAFGQLIHHIIVFGQQLTRHIKRHCIFAMRIDDAAQLIGNIGGRLIPICPHTANTRIQESTFRTHGFAECRAFDTQATKIGWMLRIALNQQGLLFARMARVDFGQYTAADTAIGTSGFDHAMML